MDIRLGVDGVCNQAVAKENPPSKGKEAFGNDRLEENKTMSIKRYDHLDKHRR